MGHPRQKPAGHYVSQVMRSVERQQRSKDSAARTSPSDGEHVIMREPGGEILIKSSVVKFAGWLIRGQQEGEEGQGSNTVAVLL